MNRIAVGAISVITLVSGCQKPTAAEVNASVPISVDEFVQKSDGLVGSKVSIRGFLASISPGLVLYRSPDSVEDLATGEVVIVTDLNLRFQAIDGMNRGEASILENAGCTEKFAIVTGTAGETGLDRVGLISIEQVRTFADASQSGEGDLCFDRSNWTK